MKSFSRAESFELLAEVQVSAQAGVQVPAFNCFIKIVLKFAINL